MKTKKKTKTKTKLKEAVLSLEEVFNQVALLPPTVARNNVILTPLSSEACLAKGINPDYLQRRGFETFGHGSSDSLEIQQLKYESYDNRRHDLMEIALKEKARLGNKQKPRPKIGCGDDQSVALSENPSLTPSGVLMQQQNFNGTLLEMEEKRLQKAREKQKRELLQLLQFEEKLDQIQKDVHLKAEKDALEEERKRAQKKKQERRQAEERRVRELRRKAQEDAEEETNRINTRQRFEKELQIKKEREHQETENKKRQRQLEEERGKKRELQRLQTEKQQLIKRRDAEKRIKEREIKEKERQIKIEKKRAMDLHEQEMKRKEAAKRIAKNKKSAQRHEEERKKVVMDTMVKNQQQHEYIAAMREEERCMQKKEKETMARKREYQAQLTKEREMKKKNALVQKFNDDERKVERIQVMKAQEMSLIKEEKELHLQLKRENADRIKRMQEYKRIETMKKITENYARTEEMITQKEHLAKTRQKNAVEAKIRKDKLMQILEKSKTRGGNAIKKILAQLDNNETITSADVTKKKPLSAMDLSIPKQHKKAAKESSNETKPPSIIEIGPPPAAPTLVNRITKNFVHEEYISPYTTTRIRNK